MEAHLDREKELTERLAYHRYLSSRRWQIFAGFTVVNGLLFNALPNMITIGESSSWVMVLLSITALVCANACLKLLSHDRESLETNYAALDILSEKPFLRPFPWGKYGKNGITFWLYVSVLSLSVPWIVLLGIYLAIWWALTAAFLFVVLIRITGIRFRHRKKQEALQDLEITNSAN